MTEPETIFPEPGSPPDVLRAARVNVIELIRGGIPPREFVAGSGGLIPKAKRVHIAAAAKSGKSLALAVVTALDIVAYGGRVAILDRENGPDEYARRLESVLDARGADEAERDVVAERLDYYAWPRMDLLWREDPAYPAEFADAAVVIFDSTRSHTAPLGLTEDASDDWAEFTSALIDPLMRAGIATVTLDNMGHEDKGRSRGTSAKADLCDLELTAKVIRPFTRDVAGVVQMQCAHSRLGELGVGDRWQMELGGGSYSSWQRVERPESGKPFRPTGFMERVSRVIEQTPGIGTKAIRTAISGGNEYIDLALDLLISGGYVEAAEGSRNARLHTIVRPYREDDDPHRATVPGACRERAAAPSEATVPPCPAPIGGTVPGTVSAAPEDGDRAASANGDRAGV